ncbi:MAG: DivIVA domain-containing protein [Anaerovoracaceae bacterium]|jgi:cell division initiation protein
MITPLAIQKKEFSKVIRGYKASEVDVFLDELTLDYEKVIKSNAKLKEQVSLLQKEMEELRNSQGQAEQRAEVILKNAQQDAESEISKAREEARKVIDEYKSLKNRYETFRQRYRALLRDELERFDRLDQFILRDSDENRLEDILDMNGDREPQPDEDRKTCVVDMKKDSDKEGGE